MRIFPCHLLILATLAVAMAAEPTGEADVFEGKLFTNAANETLAYRLYAPANIPDKQKLPLVVFLHGNGAQGNDFLDSNGRPWAAEHDVFTKDQANHPCFVLRPRCRLHQRWASVVWERGPQPQVEITQSMRLMLELIDVLERELPIDSDRIYLGGFSMGGYGTWDAITRQPSRFAAAFPISGGGDPTKVAAVSHLPIWAFHGDADTVVPPLGSTAMVKALTAAGGSAKLTIGPGISHVTMLSVALATPGLGEWLFAQRSAAKRDAAAPGR